MNSAKGKYKNLPKGASRVPSLNMFREAPSTVINNKTSVIKQTRFNGSLLDYMDRVLMFIVILTSM